MNAFLDLDHLIKRLTRNRDIISLSILIKQDSFDANCLNDETILINRFRINIVSFDVKDRSLLNNVEFHLFFHFIKNVFNQIFCLLYVLLSSVERINEMRHQWNDQRLYAEKVWFWFVEISLMIIDYDFLCIVEIFDRISFAIWWVFYSSNLIL